MKIQLNLVMFTTMVGVFRANAISLRSKNGEARRTQTTADEEETGPHEGCKLLLKENHDPQPAQVGAAYEATLSANSNYHVSSEAGATAATCNNGLAGGYPCNNVDLLSMISLSDIKSGGSSMANDIWGWTSSGREFAIIGLMEGTAFVEITDPYNPVKRGYLPTKTSNSSWRDVKTIGDYALIVSEAGGHGMQVFDLTQLFNASPNQNFQETAHYSDFGNAHNVFVNEETEYAYAVGTSTCNGGLHVVQMSNPLNPVSAGCFSSDGYTHDVQCVVYNGPDSSYNGREICFASNEDTVTIIDVTNKNNMVQLARKSYSGDRYTHQGWLTEDHRYFIFNDELDEYQGGASKTRTHVFDVTDLNNPDYKGYHEGRTAAIDHNLYVQGDLVFQANYRAGLNILEIRDMAAADFEEAGYFDIYPNSDSNRFNGAWSTYPYFPSGTIVVSGIESGLFVLKYNGQTSPQTPAPVPQTPAPVPQTPAPVPQTPAPVPQTPAPVPQTPAPVPSPNQPQTPATWGIDRVDQRDLPLSNSYGVSGSGSGVTAYIIDTGIRHSHDEFGGRATFGTNTIDGDNEDCNGHGTHVAGTVGGSTYGVAKNVDLVSVKVLNCNGGGTLASVVEGIEWTMNNAAGKKATANMSLGGGKSNAINTAVAALVSSGVPTVVAAGNSNADACNYSPASEASAITVGSTDDNDNRSSFSNYGSCLDIYAPGRSITSAWINSDSSTNSISGTSMASPHVCGGVALLLEAGIDAADTSTELATRSTANKVIDAKPGSPNRLLYVGETGPTSAPTPAPPTSAPTPCIANEIIVEVTTDSYPLETGWLIVDKANPNKSVMSKNKGGYTNPGTAYTDTGCIPNAEYEFTITDDYGDGICCSYGSGSYKVTYNGAVVAEGGQFGQSETKEFGEVVEPTPSPVNPTQPPVTAPIGSPVGSPIGSPIDDPFEIIFEESFEDEEYEMVNAGKKRVDSSENPTIGDYSLRLKKRQNIGSKMKPVRDYSTLKIDFKFYGKGMEDDEYFILESKFNGSPWTEEEKWVKGGDFNNNEWEDASVLLEVGNKKKMKFRIKAFADQSDDQIFLDDIVLSGLP